MAEPTYTGVPGGGRTLFVLDSKNTEGGRPFTIHGYRAFAALRDVEGNEAHLIMGTGVPSDVATYDDAPLGSLYFNYAGGNGTCLYVKESVEDGGNAGWAAVTTGVEA